MHHLFTYGLKHTIFVTDCSCLEIIICFSVGLKQFIPVPLCDLMILYLLL